MTRRENTAINKGGSRLHRIKRSRHTRRVVAIVLFGVLVALSDNLFTITQQSYSLAPSSNAIGSVATQGKHSASQPTGTSAGQADAAKKAAAAAAAASAQAASAANIPKPGWAGMPLYVDPTNEATQYAAANPGAADVNLIAREGQVPVANWYGDWTADPTGDANAYVTAATGAHALPVLVLYNIPDRDCGGYSVGGADSVATYTAWVQKVASGIGGRQAIVVLEPDALGALDCLAPADQQIRLQSLSQGVTILKSQTGASVYIDAGTAAWQPADVMAGRLKSANIAAADGFSLNVSYFASNAMNYAYGNQLSKLVGNKHYVFDTSRNGGNQTVGGAMCNPSTALLGSTPTTNTGVKLNDAQLWIKIPWESDGQCNGSPGPGVVYWSYATQLAKNAGW